MKNGFSFVELLCVKAIILAAMTLLVSIGIVVWWNFKHPSSAGPWSAGRKQSIHQAWDETVNPKRPEKIEDTRDIHDRQMRADRKARIIRDKWETHYGPR